MTMSRDKKQIQLIDSLTPSTTMESLFFHLIVNTDVGCDDAMCGYDTEEDLSWFKQMNKNNLIMLEKLEKILIDKKIIKKDELRSEHWQIDQEYFIDYAPRLKVYERIRQQMNKENEDG